MPSNTVVPRLRHHFGQDIQIREISTFRAARSTLLTPCAGACLTCCGWRRRGGGARLQSVGLNVSVLPRSITCLLRTCSSFRLAARRARCSRYLSAFIARGGVTMMTFVLTPTSCVERWPPQRTLLRSGQKPRRTSAAVLSAGHHPSVIEPRLLLAYYTARKSPPIRPDRTARRRCLRTIMPQQPRPRSSLWQPRQLIAVLISCACVFIYAAAEGDARPLRKLLCGGIGFACTPTVPYDTVAASAVAAAAARSAAAARLTPVAAATPATATAIAISNAAPGAAVATPAAAVAAPAAAAVVPVVALPAVGSAPVAASAASTAAARSAASAPPPTVPAQMPPPTAVLPVPAAAAAATQPSLPPPSSWPPIRLSATIVSETTLSSAPPDECCLSDTALPPTTGASAAPAQPPAG